MSGGSFNYLFVKDLGELVECCHSDLDAMVKALKEEGDSKAARDTEEVFNAIVELVKHIDRLSKLRDVWQAMEWYVSCDTSQDQMLEAIRKYEEL